MTTVTQTETTQQVGLTFGGLVAAERIKLLSRVSTLWVAGLIAAMMIATAVSMAFELDPGGVIDATEVAQLVTGGVVGAQFAGLVLGAIAVGGEYKTGAIRSTFNADPGRLRTLAAKGVVAASASALVTLGAGVLAFVVAQIVLRFLGASPELVDPVALRMLLGAALHVGAVTVMGVGMAAALRKTAPAVSLMIALIWTLPAAASVLPTGIAGTVVSFMPSTAGASLYAAGSGQSAAAFSAMSVQGAETLPFLAGLAVLLVWVVLFWSLGAWRTVRRDV
ncbi:MAG: hypothetical protein QM604_04220 [Microbacterium sp.]